MKKLHAFCLFIGIAILGFSCSNELDLTAEWQDIPIVYGLLSRADTAHYIKIQKAFLDETESALDIAQISDSLYYDEGEINVEVKHLKSGKTYQLKRVDGNLEGYQKEEGIFSDAPNYLYKFKLDANEELVEGETYQLKIKRGDDELEVIAEDVIVSDVKVNSPNITTPLKIIYRDFPVRWTSGDDARLFDFSLVFNYTEIYLDPDSTNNFVEKSIVWKVKQYIPREEGSSVQTVFDIPGESFYQFLEAEIEADPLINRWQTSIQFVIDAGGEEIFQYIFIGQANTGITSSQVIPTYTNLDPEGYGVFSSVNKVITDPYPSFHKAMRDSMEFGIYTKDLNFQF